MSTPWTPTSVLAQAVYAAGFLYDPDQDIIYSRMDALQRNFGYAFGYDAAALAMNAVIDCEPIFFDHDGKHWMIELWKGQYGLETGCEIGVYTRPIGSTGAGYALLDATVGVRPGDGVPSHNLFYDCASDADRLELSATLRRNGTVLFTRGQHQDCEHGHSQDDRTYFCFIPTPNWFPARTTFPLAMARSSTFSLCTWRPASSCNAVTIFFVVTSMISPVEE